MYRIGREGTRFSFHLRWFALFFLSAVAVAERVADLLGQRSDE